jgi:phage gp36-like protein
LTYATQAQLTDRYGARTLIALTDRAEVATGAIVTAVVDRALADTDAQIDGHLAARYALPLTATPALIADIAQVIAIWKLHPYDPDPKIRRDYDDALRALRDIADGRVKLDLAGAEPEGSGSGGVRITDRERPLTETNLKGFI